jgi:hypothetical protein
MRYSIAICSARAHDTATRPGRQFARAMCGLTLELSGPQRHGAWPVRRTINQGVARAKRHAVAGPLERRVRPHSWALAVRAGRAACDGPACLLPEPRGKLDPSNGLAAPYAARLHQLTNLSAMMRRRGLPTQLEVLRLL